MKKKQLKTRNIRFDDFLWKELEKTSKSIKQDKSKFVRAAVIEKIQKVERGF